MKQLLPMTISALLLSVGTTWAEPLDDGFAAQACGDYANAIKIYRQLAVQGDASAQLKLGVMYFSGQGDMLDYSEGIKWFRLAAAQGDATAQRNLGFIYGNGKGVAQDYAESAKWYRLAATLGD